MLCTGSDEQKCQLQIQLFMKDEDSLSRNSGLADRYEFTKESRTLELEGSRIEDILDLDKNLINGEDIYMNVLDLVRPSS